MVYRLPILLSSMLFVAFSMVVLARAISSEVNFPLPSLGTKEQTVKIIFESIAGICFQRLERMAVRATSVISSRSTMLSKTSSGNLLSMSTSLSNMSREDFPRPIWQQVACEESCWSPIKRYRGCRQARNMLTAIGSCYQWKLWFKYRKFINTMENIEKGIEDFDCNPEGIEILLKKKPLRSVTAAGRGAA